MTEALSHFSTISIKSLESPPHLFILCINTQQPSNSLSFSLTPWNSFQFSPYFSPFFFCFLRDVITMLICCCFCSPHYHLFMQFEFQVSKKMPFFFLGGAASLAILISGSFMRYAASSLFFTDMLVAEFKGEEYLSAWHITHFLRQGAATKPSALSLNICRHSEDQISSRPPFSICIIDMKNKCGSSSDHFATDVHVLKNIV